MQLLVDDLVIDIIKKKIKNTYLRVHRLTGKIHISAPIKIDEHSLLGFITSKLDWIKSQLTKIDHTKFIAEKNRNILVLTTEQRRLFHKTVQDLVSKWQPIIGVYVKETRIRKMKTKWGTCNTVKQRIWLSTALAAKPADCLEYVVVHEMVHLLERRHNHRFYAFMDQFLPTWRATKSKLNY